VAVGMAVGSPVVSVGGAKAVYPRLCGSLLVCARFVCKKRLLYFCGTQAQGAHRATHGLAVCHLCAVT
jgi:hypothetical protein